MKEIENFTIHEESTILEAVQLIERNESRAIITLSEGGKVVGVFTEGDLLRAIMKGVDLRAPLSQVQTVSFRSIRDDDFESAIPLFKEGITLVPVLDDDFRLVNVYTIDEFLKSLH